jgi:hypothetical protein
MVRASKYYRAKIKFTIVCMRNRLEKYSRLPAEHNFEMAAVYKSLSKSNGHKEEGSSNEVKKNRQKVLILSSRGVTYR